MNEPVTIAAAYIRVSSDDQLEYSPDSQLKVIRDYARREGYVIPDEFVYREKEGISGKKAEKRPQFRLMIATAKEPEPPFRVIFVWKFSRFARNQEEAIMYKNLLKKRGIAVRSISEPSSDSPFSSLIERIIEWMDEYYLINLAGEVRRGMKEKAARGEAMGTAPFGYRVKDKTFVVREDEAAIVKEIFRAYADGEGMRRLARRMGDRGVRTRRGNVPDNRWIQYILQNVTYIGKIRWSTEGHANYSRAAYNGENVLTADGRHPAIIEMDLWERVQQRLDGRDTELKYARTGSSVFMLKGLLRCGDCGATLTLVNTASPSLQCHKYARGQCGVSHSVTLGKANDAVIRGLEAAAASGAFTFVPALPKEQPVTHDWDRLILSEEQRLRRARNGFLDGVFTSDEYMGIRDEIADNIARMRATKELEDAAARPPADPDPDVFRSRVLEVLDLIRSPDVSEDAKNQALRSILTKIVFQKPDNSFDFYFHT